MTVTICTIDWKTTNVIIPFYMITTYITLNLHDSLLSSYIYAYCTAIQIDFKMLVVI